MSATRKDCAYKFHLRMARETLSPCPEPAHESSDYCVLHIDLPDEGDAEFETIIKAKKDRTQEKIDAGDFNFEGAQLVEFSAERKDIDQANFYQAKFYRDVWFNGATFSGFTTFDGAKFSGSAWFNGATFSDSAWFVGATFSGNAMFNGAKFSGSALFSAAKFSGDATFDEATFSGNAMFDIAKFSRDAWFNGATFSRDAWFERATLIGDALFNEATFLKEIYAFKATFGYPAGQEGLCRAAKQAWDKVGNRSQADYYFYREMEAKRKRKPSFWRWLELPAQYIFGYGVHPERLFIAFVIALIAFGIFYWPQGAPWVQGVPSPSLLNSFYFSFTTMLLPGSGLLNPQPGIAGVAVIVQALFGLLVWGTFIATLTRKFGR